MKTYYQILGVEERATPAQIKKAYRHLSLQVHPDRNQGQDGLFKLVNEAHNILSDTEKRAEYDAILKHQSIHLIAQRKIVKPAIVLETMAQLGMNDRYTPVGHHSSIHTFFGDYVYIEDATLPTKDELQQMALDQFVEAAREQYRDIDLIAAVRIEFAKPHINKQAEEPTPNTWDKRFDYVDSEYVTRYRHTHVTFRQLAVDYRITADLFKEMKPKKTKSSSKKRDK